MNASWFVVVVVGPILNFCFMKKDILNSSHFVFAVLFLFCYYSDLSEIIIVAIVCYCYSVWLSLSDIGMFIY